MIEVKNLSYSIGKKDILDRIDLTLRDGSVMGLVGINGAGKTTLLRLISGVLTTDMGQILIDGNSVFREDSRKELFFLPDDPYYTIHTTGEALFKMYAVFYPHPNSRSTHTEIRASFCEFRGDRDFQTTTLLCCNPWGHKELDRA